MCLTEIGAAAGVSLKSYKDLDFLHFIVDFIKNLIQLQYLIM